jgi:hypothetical protein
MLGVIHPDLLLVKFSGIKLGNSHRSLRGLPYHIPAGEGVRGQMLVNPRRDNGIPRGPSGGMKAPLEAAMLLLEHPRVSTVQRRSAARNFYPASYLWCPQSTSSYAAKRSPTSDKLGTLDVAIILPLWSLFS